MKAGEFAKQFWVDGLNFDCSPVSPKLVLRSNHPYAILAIHEKYKVTDMRLLSRLYGTRFKERSKPIHLHKRFSFIRLYIEKKAVDLKFWLGGGVPLGPYEYGAIIHDMVQSLKPKELNIFPESGLPRIHLDDKRNQVNSSDMTFLLEKTIRMEKYKKDLHWYCTKACAPDVTLEVLLDPPEYQHNWTTNELPLDLVKLNQLWKYFQKFFYKRKVIQSYPALYPTTHLFCLDEGPWVIKVDARLLSCSTLDKPH